MMVSDCEVLSAGRREDGGWWVTLSQPSSLEEKIPEREGEGKEHEEGDEAGEDGPEGGGRDCGGGGFVAGGGGCGGGGRGERSGGVEEDFGGGSDVVFLAGGSGGGWGEWCWVFVVGLRHCGG